MTKTLDLRQQAKAATSEAARIERGVQTFYDDADAMHQKVGKLHRKAQSMQLRAQEMLAEARDVRKKRNSQRKTK